MEKKAGNYCKEAKGCLGYQVAVLKEQSRDIIILERKARRKERDNPRIEE